MATTPPSPSRVADRKRKIRAILAGGVVLGVGATVTLAAWNDSVFVQGDFAVGDFNIQGDVHDGGGFLEYDDELAPGILQLPLIAENLAPGDIVHAPVSLRVDPTRNSYDADVELRGGTWAASVLADELRYTVYTDVPVASCQSGDLSAGAPLVGSEATPVTLDTGAGTVPGSPAFTLLRDSTVLDLCFAVTLPETVDMTSVPPNSTATVLWEFYSEPVS
ncbi:SipW-dependent-type signal peptide-containing protein [Lolliginicoccus suaedae]|uniref:SipW-dependent-type signal peptide-containing protein n=1 Tax=Lolliginicoccus suaedae TaxID=2605429 RepID=UPI0011EFD3C7|nr:SipW-dependent-type signal peptide-containing protein [Lolliginicoccus suaedae]